MSNGFGHPKDKHIAKPSQKTLKFINEALILIAETKASQEKLYIYFQVNLEQLNESLLLTLPSIFKKYIRETDPPSIAMLFGDFGSFIGQFPLGRPWLNREISIVARQLALRIYTREAFPEQWAMTQSNLTGAYLYRILGERSENIEQAINAAKLALQINTYEAFPEQWAMTQNNLAAAYIFRIAGDRSDNIEQAISACHLALQYYSYEAFKHEWATLQENLSIAYIYRIQGERANNIEQAIDAAQAALKVLTFEASPQNWGLAQNNLATAYRDRLIGNRAENIEQSIDTFKLALKALSRKDFPEKWAAIQNNLGITYRVRIQGDHADNLEQAISFYKLALQVRTRDSFLEDWAATQNNLANAYSDRIKGNRVENLEQSINAAKFSLEVYTRTAFPEKWAGTQNNLAAAYSENLQRGSAKNFEQAITAYELALQIYTHDSFPKECRQTSRGLGHLHFERRNWELAATAYATALAAAETLYQSCILLNGKAVELTETADLPRRTAYVLARTGKLSEAVETLEQGRARGLSESLDRDRADLTQLERTNPGLYRQYQSITQQLRNLESQQRDISTSSERHSLTPNALRDAAISLRQQLADVLQHIRQVTGYEQFLALPTFADIRRTVQPDYPLIYLVPTPAGSLALIITTDAIHDIWLDTINETQMIDLLGQTWFAAYEQSQQDRQVWFDAIEVVTRQLWEPLMAPLITQIQQHNFHQATLIPTGFLSFLPLHAAWIEDETRPTGRRYALDEIHITYAPNAKSLTAAQVIAQRSGAEAILAIDNPHQDLPNSNREVIAAVASFSQSEILQHQYATTVAVKKHLPEASIAHFSCHGTAKLNSPLTSGLLMSDGLLTLKDIFALNLADCGGLRLAILSACETGMIGTENVDEAISLPTGLLQAGVAAVIASLWSVSDLSTMLLLTRFYDLWRNAELEPPLALTQAQQWIRDTTNQQKYDYLKSHFQSLVSQGQMAEQDVNHLLREFIIHYIYGDGPNSRSFAHPFHWAAFSYTGV